MAPPQFADKEEVRFLCNSPVFVKRSIPDSSRPDGVNDKFYLYTDPESDALLTETLQHKLRTAGFDPEGVSVRFDRDYAKAKTQLVRYRNIENRCSYCPVFVKGTAEQLAFAWTVGIGNSTGVGFGSVYVADGGEKKQPRR